MRKTDMVKNIIKDTDFLQKMAEPATRKDKAVAEDLLDTLKANKAICVGLAANMIGVKKRIIAINFIITFWTINLVYTRIIIHYLN